MPAACGSPSGSAGLSLREIDLPSEGVRDHSAIVFQAGEDAWFGDAVRSHGEIIEDAQAGHGSYVAEGRVGCCAWFRERFTVPG